MLLNNRYLKIVTSFEVSSIIAAYKRLKFKSQISLPLKIVRPKFKKLW